MKFFRRTSAGSMPTSYATRSITRSIRCVASGRPAPRYGSVGVLFVKTPTARPSSACNLYAPCASSTPTVWNVPNMPTYAPRSSHWVARRPRTVPSRLAAISTSQVWARPWVVALRSSLRSPIHFTGRPSLTAATQARTSSEYTRSLEPNPPPTSGAITRTFCSGMPTMIPRKILRKWGTWVDDHTVSCLPNGVYSATTPRVSMATGKSRC